MFRTLKSAAMRAEESQVTDVRGFTKLAIIGLTAAVRIVQIAPGRDGTTGQSMPDAVAATTAPALQAIYRKVEGKTAALKNPHEPASLAWLAWIVGRLGGRSGYTSRGDKPPGPKTIARGLARLDGLIAGWNIAVHYHIEHISFRRCATPIAQREAASSRTEISAIPITPTPIPGSSTRRRRRIHLVRKRFHIARQQSWAGDNEVWQRSEQSRQVELFVPSGKYPRNLRSLRLTAPIVGATRPRWTAMASTRQGRGSK